MLCSSFRPCEWMCRDIERFGCSAGSPKIARTATVPSPSVRFLAAHGLDGSRKPIIRSVRALLVAYRTDAAAANCKLLIATIKRVFQPVACGVMYNVMVPVDCRNPTGRWFNILSPAAYLCKFITLPQHHFHLHLSWLQTRLLQALHRL
jgi:hypothetical protein